MMISERTKALGSVCRFLFVVAASISLHFEQRSADGLSNVLAKLSDFENKTWVHSLLSFHVVRLLSL